jgi:hypothetical protein
MNISAMWRDVKPHEYLPAVDRKVPRVFMVYRWLIRLTYTRSEFYSVVATIKPPIGKLRNDKGIVRSECQQRVPTIVIVATYVFDRYRSFNWSVPVRRGRWNQGRIPSPSSDDVLSLMRRYLR